MNIFNENKLLADFIWAANELNSNQLENAGIVSGYFTSSVILPPSCHILDGDVDKLIDVYIENKQSALNQSTNQMLDDQLRQLLIDVDLEKIFFHCGTPKTGSSSFQATAINETDRLENQFILYPSVIKNHEEPKHQELVASMKKNDVDGLLAFFKRVFIEASQKKLTQIVISTEGLFNHWDDFTDGMKMVFATINEYVPVKLLLVLREPKSFLYSMYLQNLKNPQTSHPVCYGQDWSFEEMLNDAWFVNHIDYMAFILAFESMLGKDAIQLIAYSKQVVSDLFTAIGVSLCANSVVSKNITSKQLSLTELRKINRLNLSKKEKRMHIERVMSSESLSTKDSIIENTMVKIDWLFMLQRVAIKQRYGLVI